MKFIHYSRYTGEDMGIGAEELLQALSDFLLESGFNTRDWPVKIGNSETIVRCHWMNCRQTDN